MANPQLAQWPMCNCEAGNDAYLFCHGDTCAYKRAIVGSLTDTRAREVLEDCCKLVHNAATELTTSAHWSGAPKECAQRILKIEVAIRAHFEKEMR
jgi:hypothetical protein